MVHTYSSGCKMGGLNTDSGEPGLPVDRVDCCLTLRSCRLDLSGLTLYCSSHPSSKILSSWQSSTIVIQLPQLAVAGLLPEMTDFAQGLIYNGEESKSIHILLEMHWPELVGRDEPGWLEFW